MDGAGNGHDPKSISFSENGKTVFRGSAFPAARFPIRPAKNAKNRAGLLTQTGPTILPYVRLLNPDAQELSREVIRRVQPLFRHQEPHGIQGTVQGGIRRIPEQRHHLSVGNAAHRARRPGSPPRRSRPGPPRLLR